MENGWVKVYRKIGDSDIMFDDKGLRVFMWLLINVDKETGKCTVGRNRLAMALRIDPNTVYKVLKRLEKKYKMVTLKSNSKYTEVSLLNWAKYQSKEKVVTQQGNNQVTTQQQQSNTKQELENKELRINTIATSQQLLEETKDPIKKENPYVRLAEERQQPIHRLCYLIEDLQGTKIVNWGKQAKALGMLTKAEYTEKQIAYTIRKMKQDEFYQDKGFDLMTVVNVIDKFKARDVAKEQAQQPRRFE